MAKNESKTVPTSVSVDEFIATVEPAHRRADAERLVEIMQQETGEPPVMWGPSIVGFGSYHYKYASGREGDAAAVGFSPRKPQSVLYLIGGIEDRHQDEMAKLGPHKTGKGCLYIKKLDDVDEPTLRYLIRDSYERIKAEYPD